MTVPVSAQSCLSVFGRRCFAACLAVALLSSGGAWSASAEVIINEVMADNSSIILPNNDVTDYTCDPAQVADP